MYKQLEGSRMVIKAGAFVGQRAACVIADVDSRLELADVVRADAVAIARGSTRTETALNWRTTAVSIQ